MDVGAGVVVGRRERGDLPPSKSPEFGAVLVIEKCASRAAEGGVVWLWFQSRVFLWKQGGFVACSRGQRPRAPHPQAP